MPTYVYSCKKCNILIEVTRKITEDVSTCVCKSCDTLAEQVIMPVEWRLKGGGWYETLEKSADLASKGIKSENKKRIYRKD